MLKKREEVKKILEMDIDRNEKYERLAKLNTITANLSRQVMIDDINDFKLGEGQIVNNLGHSWGRENCEYNANEFGNISIVFFADNVTGYEVQYLNIDDLMYELDLSEEEAEEIEFDEVYQDLLHLLATTSNASKEKEVLVSSNTEFIVKRILKDETSIEVELEVK